MPTQAEHSTLFSKTRVAAITELRHGFTIYGFDVSAYKDDQVSGAVVAAATADTQSSRDLFTRAFERLRDQVTINRYELERQGAPASIGATG